MTPAINCPRCEYSVDLARDKECPKCGERIRGQTFQPLLEVDVAHSREDWDAAQRKIIAAFDHALLHGHRGVKIIHGHGSATGRSLIRQRSVPLLRSLAIKTGGKLVQDKENPGAHILWLDR